MQSPLTSIQNHIAQLYETPVGFSVEDFLITDLAAIGIATRQQNLKTEETLYILETGDGLDVSLFLEKSIVKCLERCLATNTWDFGDVKDYLLALEGVSHFQYLIWNALRQKSITLFELELQAEIDKFILSAITLAKQRDGQVPKDLHGYLFEQVSYKNTLGTAASNRYREANHYASKYCRSLKANFPELLARQEFLAEIRGFYRLTQNEKVRRIESMN